MIEQEAVVVATEGDYAIVEVQRQGSCGHCAVNKTCGTSLLANWFGSRRHRQRALNQAHATVGDHVVVGINESMLLKLSVLSYLLPLVCMVMLAISGRWLMQQLAISVTDAKLLLFAVAGWLLGWLPMYLMKHRHQQQADYHPIVLQRKPTHSIHTVTFVSKEL